MLRGTLIKPVMGCKVNHLRIADCRCSLELLLYLLVVCRVIFEVPKQLGAPARGQWE